MALTHRRLRFVQLYDGDAKAAAIAAGFSAKTAKQIGSVLMQQPEIIEAIQAREDKELSPAIATRRERQAMWTAKMRDEQAKLVDRLKASELLGRSEADFTEKLEVRGELTLRDLVQESRGGTAPKAAAPVAPSAELDT